MTPKQVLVSALRAAGANMRRRIGRVGFRYKGKANLVTKVDKGNEAMILGKILKAFPDHGYLSEERAPRLGRRFTWVIDPLDGTTNFAHTFPVSCVSIGLLKSSLLPAERGEGGRRPDEGQRAVLAGVYDPFRDELFLAERGRGATMNGKRLRVSSTRSLEESLLLTGFPYDRADRAAYYLNFYKAFVERCHDVRRSGSAALDMCWVACGRVDAFWEFKLHAWDVAAGMLLVKEAGGAVTDFRGREWIGPVEGFGRQTLASNGKIHAEVLRVIRRHLEK